MSFLALAQRFLYFHFWLFLCVGCFCFGSNGFYARRCFVLEMYSHCRCVPALRGQSFWDSEEYCSDVGRSLGLLEFPTQAWRSVACSWFSSPSFLLSSLNTSNAPCQHPHWEREICLVFFCSWSGHDVFAGQVFGDRPSRVLRRPRAKQPSLGASGTEGSRRWRRVCCLFSRCMWRSGNRQVHNSVPSLCDVRFTSVLWLNNWVRQRCTKPVTLHGVTVTT